MILKEQVLKQLQRSKELSDGDPEMGHQDADQILLEYINDPDITAAFKAIRRWYA